MPPSSSTSENHQRRNRQPVPARMGMRKWLEHLLDNSQCWGLQWEDKTQKIFSIVWKHASSHGFDHSKHAQVYIKWAMYKGRTVKRERGKRKINSDDYDSKHKSNFRCALHSLIDCIDVSGDEDSSKKFFQFIDSSDPQYKVRRDRKRNSYHKKGKKRTYDGKFSEVQNSTHKTDVQKEDMKESCEPVEDEIRTSQETDFGDALMGDQNPVDYRADTPDQLSGQTLPDPAFTQDMATIGLIPPITLLPQEATGQVQIIYEDTSQEPNESLPNFEALGVKDQYGPKKYVTSTQLGNGGEMSIKKEAEVTPVIAGPIIMVSSQPDVQNELLFEREIPAVEEFITLMDANSSQQETEESIMNDFISPDAFLQYPEHSEVITRSTYILNNIQEMQFTQNFGLEFTSEPDEYCDSF